VRSRQGLLLGLLILALAGCGSQDARSGGASGTASPALTTPAPAATQAVPAASATPAAAGLSISQLKYRLIDHFGGMGESGIFYCDPDLYPIAREGREEQQARDLLPTIQADAELFGAIRVRLGLDATQAFSAEQQLQIYREYKRLSRIQLEPAESGYRFSLPVTAYNGASNGQPAGGRGRLRVPDLPGQRHHDRHAGRPAGGAVARGWDAGLDPR
jgi:hypothetical protein